MFILDMFGTSCICSITASVYRVLREPLSKGWMGLGPILIDSLNLSLILKRTLFIFR